MHQEPAYWKRITTRQQKRLFSSKRHQMSISYGNKQFISIWFVLWEILPEHNSTRPVEASVSTDGADHFCRKLAKSVSSALWVWKCPAYFDEWHKSPPFFCVQNAIVFHLLFPKLFLILGMTHQKKITTLLTSVQRNNLFPFFLTLSLSYNQENLSTDFCWCAGVMWTGSHARHNLWHSDFQATARHCSLNDGQGFFMMWRGKKMYFAFLWSLCPIIDFRFSDVLSHQL